MVKRNNVKNLESKTQKSNSSQFYIFTTKHSDQINKNKLYHRVYVIHFSINNNIKIKKSKKVYYGAD